MTKGSNFWVIGGEFGSMNFHKLVEGSAQVQGPFKTRKEAEDAWKTVSEENRHKAGVRFSIVEEPESASLPEVSPERLLPTLEETSKENEGRPHPDSPGGAVCFSTETRLFNQNLSHWEQTSFAENMVTARLTPPTLQDKGGPQMSDVQSTATTEPNRRGCAMRCARRGSRPPTAPASSSNCAMPKWRGSRS